MISEGATGMSSELGESIGGESDGGEMGQLMELFELSFARCLGHGDFLASFYERFVSSSEQVREKFAHTNLEKQKDMLKRSLYLIARAAMGLEEGLEHLESIARSHSKKGLDISPSLYDTWFDNLIATVAEYDPEYSPRVGIAWERVVRPGIDRMIKVYREEQTMRPRR